MMKHKLLFLLLVLLGFLRLQAQNDNPYAIFGHEGKILKTPELELIKRKSKMPKSSCDIAIVPLIVKKLLNTMSKFE